jgi:hypothetical protein
VASVDRRHVAYVNQYHITEQKLLDAIVSVINRYNRFELIKWWGSGKRASGLRHEPGQCAGTGGQSLFE